MLWWARANGCLWDENTCISAASGGHLEVLQWARANGCPWDEDTCAAAAEGGHLKVLQWARANGCPCNANTCKTAASEGHLEVLHWARANGFPFDAKTTLFIAAQRGHETVLRALIEAGAGVNKTIDGGVTLLFMAAQTATRRLCGRLSSWVQTSTRRRITT